MSRDINLINVSDAHVCSEAEEGQSNQMWATDVGIKSSRPFEWLNLAQLLKFVVDQSHETKSVAPAVLTAYTQGPRKGSLRSHGHTLFHNSRRSLALRLL